MLISCPECGKEVSDKSEICVSCGYPIKEYVKELQEEEKQKELPKCPYCQSIDIDKDGYCNECGMNTIPNKKKGFIDGVADCLLGMVGQEPMEDKKIINKSVSEVQCNKDFNGIYKYNWKGEKIEVYCPRCNSENCSYHIEEKTIQGKTKTSYSLNLNPLKPFTPLNKKEKVVRKDYTYTDKQIFCNDCGMVFH